MQIKISTVKIPDWIATRVYYPKKTSDVCRAYISNEKLHEYLMLEGLTAELWNVICSSENIDEIRQFSVINDIENELNNFLFELADVGLLLLNGKEYTGASVSAEMSVNDKQSSEFTDNMRNWLLENKMLNSLFIELTYKCNLKCIHCFNDKDDFISEVSFEKIKPVIDEAIELGIFHVCLSGGEATLSKDFLKIIKYIRSKRLALEIFTNGQFLYDNPELLDEIIKVYPHYIGISLYSMDPLIHDKITGVEGSYNKTVSVIKKIKENNINVNIKCILLKENISSYIGVFKFADTIGASASFDNSFLYNKLRNNYDVQMTETQLIELYSNEHTIFYAENDKGVDINSKFLNTKLCYGGHASLSINPKMEVYICPSLKLMVGNLNEQTLTSICNDKNQDFPLNKWRKYTKKDLQECYKEEYCKYCHYCAGKGMHENGYLKKSDIQCKIAKAKMKAVKIINK